MLQCEMYVCEDEQLKQSNERQPYKRSSPQQPSAILLESSKESGH